MIPLGSMWTREVRVPGEPPSVVTVEITRVVDGWVSGRVRKGRGSRKGRIFQDSATDWLKYWTPEKDRQAR